MVVDSIGRAGIAASLSGSDRIRPDASRRAQAASEEAAFAGCSKGLMVRDGMSIAARGKLLAMSAESSVGTRRKLCSTPTNKIGIEQTATIFARP